MQGNVSATQKFCVFLFSVRNLSDHRIFKRLYRNLRESEPFYALRHDTGTGRYRRISKGIKAVLSTVYDEPSTRSIAVVPALGVILSFGSSI